MTRKYSLSDVGFTKHSVGRINAETPSTYLNPSIIGNLHFKILQPRFIAKKLVHDLATSNY